MPISLERLHKTCDGDLEFMRELIESYLETSPGLLARIDAAIEAGDAARLTAEAHGWKGISQSMGLEELASLCRQMEDAGRRGDLSRSRRVVRLDSPCLGAYPALAPGLLERKSHEDPHRGGPAHGGTHAPTAPRASGQ